MILSCALESHVYFVREASDQLLESCILTEERDLQPIISLLHRPVDTDGFGIDTFKKDRFELVRLVVNIRQPRLTTSHSARYDLRNLVFYRREPISIASEPGDPNDGPIIKKIEVLYRFLRRYERAIDPDLSRIVDASLYLSIVLRSNAFIHGYDDGYVSHTVDIHVLGCP